MTKNLEPSPFTIQEQHTVCAKYPQVHLVPSVSFRHRPGSGKGTNRAIIKSHTDRVEQLDGAPRCRHHGKYLAWLQSSQPEEHAARMRNLRVTVSATRDSRIRPCSRLRLK